MPELPNGWHRSELGQLASISSGEPLADWLRDGLFPLMGANGEIGTAADYNFENGYLVGRVGAAGAVTDASFQCWASDNTLTVRANPQIMDHSYLGHMLCHIRLAEIATRNAQPLVTQTQLKARKCSAPAQRSEQQLIARILDTLDTQIRRTEEVITKLEQIKQDLLTDLLTRGIDENGELRPPPEEAPHLYKDSQLGRIPWEWETLPLGAMLHSAVDGPFGSNLKTEHYVDDAGVRVVRLQNVRPGWYDDTDRAFIPRGHAEQLSRNEVLPGDLLVAGLGEETHPLGRACLYPTGLPAAVNKADCYRLRALSHIALNQYIMNFLNSAAAAKQVRRYQQGVTLQRINLSNLRRLLIPVMDLAEQKLICDVLDSATRQADLAERERKKIQKQKRGLMEDLLTGRVRVTPILKEAEQAVG